VAKVLSIDEDYLGHDLVAVITKMIREELKPLEKIAPEEAQGTPCTDPGTFR
jgi:hypothetical protein